jgi:predicted AlkP superfamily pyrophosphatase or phosphodiesterase
LKNATSRGHGRAVSTTVFVASLAMTLAACSPHYIVSRPIDRAHIIAPGAAVTNNVILVSIDGLRPDAIEKFAPPTLQRLVREGS